MARRQIVKASKTKLFRVANRAVGAVLAMMPLTMLDTLARFCWRVDRLARSSRYWLGEARREIGQQVLDLPPESLSGVAHFPCLETLLDWRMTAVSPSQRDWPGLYACAEQMQQAILRSRAEFPDCPVIISPFHFVSQYINIQVCDRLRQLLDLSSLGVVSAMPYGIYGDDNTLVPNLKVFHTYADGARTSLGVSFFRALKRDGVAVLFADVAPYSLARAPMETVGVELFGRPARIHNGVFRLGAPLKARLLSFYVKFSGSGFVGTVFEPVGLEMVDAPQRVAALIERSVKDNYAQWLQGGHPAMYSFSPVK